MIKPIDKNKQTSVELDFYFGSNFVKGQRLWYINHNKTMNTVVCEDITIRTIYPRMIISNTESGEARCIDYNEREMLFDTPLEAEEVLKGFK